MKLKNSHLKNSSSKDKEEMTEVHQEEEIKEEDMVEEEEAHQDMEEEEVEEIAVMIMEEEEEITTEEVITTTITEDKEEEEDLHLTAPLLKKTENIEEITEIIEIDKVVTVEVDTVAVTIEEEAMIDVVTTIEDNILMTHNLVLLEETNKIRKERFQDCQAIKNDFDDDLLLL